ncbi:MAG: hypothetical protein ABEK10_05135 [Candidatus Nanosalina sp.]
MTAKSRRYSRIIEESVRTTGENSREETLQILNSLNVAPEKLEEVTRNAVIRITEDEKSFLQEYSSELEAAMPWAEKIKKEEQTEVKQEAFRKANSELKELEQEIQRAFKEDYTLEEIASAVRDPRLAEEAERTMSELETIQNRIKNLEEKKRKTGELLKKFEKTRSSIGTETMLQGLQIRNKAVKEILERAVVKDIGDKEVPVDLPDWEKQRFETDVIYTRIEENSDLSEMLENAKRLVEFAAENGEIPEPETGFKTGVRTGNLDHARKVSKNTSDAASPLFNHMDDATVDVWMNAAVTKYHLENRKDSGFDRLIIVHRELLDTGYALLSTLIHELMHAYFQHTGDYEGQEGHRKIHQLSIKTIAAPIRAEKENPDFTMEQLLKEIKPINRETMNKAYLYSVASETLFPGS